MLKYARLRPALTSLRMRYANLLAAARATLTAARDGEAHPLVYLIDELAAQGQLPPAETSSSVRDADGLSTWLDLTSESGESWDQR
jgi:hypothetical protein